ncbi:MAG: 3-deoxy-8-phosphooctulonate synthase [Acidobacteria bacterium]|nr:3-deoxy-8-phosphooctulonate synthase [Acidobacteriota bacterium]
MREIEIGDNVSFGGDQLGLIAGPCVIESREHCLQMAAAVSEVATAVGVPWVFKASYDKANRTSRDSFRGPGPEEGLEILSEVREVSGAPVLTDVHDVRQVEAAAAVVDILQIPAFLCRQTDLIVAAAETGLPVNVKKGQFLAPWDMAKVVEKVTAAGNEKVLVTERGASFGYNNLVVDIKGLPILAKIGYPVILDVTHSLQLPAGEGGRTGGQPEFALPLASAGVAAGVNGLFVEVHDDPPQAMSDATTQIRPSELKVLLDQATRVHGAVTEVADE